MKLLFTLLIYSVMATSPIITTTETISQPIQVAGVPADSNDCEKLLDSTLPADGELSDFDLENCNPEAEIPTSVSVMGFNSKSGEPNVSLMVVIIILLLIANGVFRGRK